MATKPTDLPEWATDPGADKTAPPTAKQEGGWLPLEKPPHQWFNWFFNLVYQWIAFLQDYAANHVHDGGASDLSAPKIQANRDIVWNTPLVPHTVGRVAYDGSDWVFSGVGVSAVALDSVGNFTLTFDEDMDESVIIVTPWAPDDSPLTSWVTVPDPYDIKKMRIRIKTLADVYKSARFDIVAYERS